MTEEQASKIIELLDVFTKADTASAIIVGIGLLFGIVLIIWECYRLKKLDKWRNEYYATLTDEQKKAVTQWRELNK